MGRMWSRGYVVLAAGLAMAGCGGIEQAQTPPEPDGPLGTVALKLDAGDFFGLAAVRIRIVGNGEECSPEFPTAVFEKTVPIMGPMVQASFVLGEGLWHACADGLDQFGNASLRCRGGTGFHVYPGLVTEVHEFLTCFADNPGVVVVTVSPNHQPVINNFDVSPGPTLPRATRRPSPCKRAIRTAMRSSTCGSRAPSEGKGRSRPSASTGLRPVSTRTRQGTSRSTLR